MQIIEQQTTTIPADITRTVMQEIVIGVTPTGTPFISEVDEIYVLWNGLWYMCEWTEFDDDSIHIAADTMRAELDRRNKPVSIAQAV